MTEVTLCPLVEEPTFGDALGITHEVLTPSVDSRLGVVSLCGRLRDPIRKEGQLGRVSALRQLRVRAQSHPPDGVDCMSCLVNRVRLDRMVDKERELLGRASPVIELDLRITSWR